MTKSKPFDKKRKIVSELKELIEHYKYGDKIYTSASEKVDLRKCKKLIRETRRNAQRIEIATKRW